MPFTPHQDATGDLWQHQEKGSQLPGLRSSVDVNYTNTTEQLRHRIARPDRDRAKCDGLYTGAPDPFNELQLDHMKRVPCSKDSMEYTSIGLLGENADQPWGEYPNKIENGPVPVVTMSLKNAEYRLKLAATIEGLSKHDVALALSFNRLATFGEAVECRERLRSAMLKVDFEQANTDESERKRISRFHEPKPFPPLNSNYTI